MCSRQPCCLVTIRRSFSFCYFCTRSFLICLLLYFLQIVFNPSQSIHNQDFHSVSLQVSGSTEVSTPTGRRSSRNPEDERRTASRHDERTSREEECKRGDDVTNVAVWESVTIMRVFICRTWKCSRITILGESRALALHLYEIDVLWLVIYYTNCCVK